MDYSLSIPLPLLKKEFSDRVYGSPLKTALIGGNAMAQTVQRYIATDDAKAFEAIIGAQHQIGEYPFGDGHIPFVKMQTEGGEPISVLPVSTRLLDALHRWNRKKTPQFTFVIYHSENGGLLHRSDTQGRPTAKPKEKTRRRKLMPKRSALALRPRKKKI